MSTFLMLAISALSMAFWSAARLLETSFFCTYGQSCCPPIFVSNQIISYLGLLSLLEEGVLAGLLLGLVGGEVLRPRDLLDLGRVDAGQIDLHGCGDDVSRVDATKRDTVDLERAGDEQNTLVEVLEQDDALAAEPTGEQDQDGTGLEGAARRPRADGLADLETSQCQYQVKNTPADRASIAVPPLSHHSPLVGRNSMCFRVPVRPPQRSPRGMFL